MWTDKEIEELGDKIAKDITSLTRHKAQGAPWWDYLRGTDAEPLAKAGWPPQGAHTAQEIAEDIEGGPVELLALAREFAGHRAQAAAVVTHEDPGVRRRVAGAFLMALGPMAQRRQYVDAMSLTLWACLRDDNPRKAAQWRTWDEAETLILDAPETVAEQVKPGTLALMTRQRDKMFVISSEPTGLGGWLSGRGWTLWEPGPGGGGSDESRHERVSSRFRSHGEASETQDDH